MDRDDEEDKTTYNVVVNHEEQYSIWPAYRENPLGWNSTGKTGLKQECLEFVKQVWTDMRPLSLRKHMAEMERKRAAGELKEEDVQREPQEWNRGPSLVERLSNGKHPIEVSLLPKKTISALEECLNREYVHIKFTQTRGGTALGIRLNRDKCNFEQADFENKKGGIHLEGELTLDYAKVRCIADLDLATLSGEGYLQPVAPVEN